MPPLKLRPNGAIKMHYYYYYYYYYHWQIISNKLTLPAEFETCCSESFLIIDNYIGYMH